MQSSGPIARARAAFKTRPWSWVGSALGIFLVVVVVLALTVEPTLAPYTAAADSANPPYRTQIDARAALEKGKARAAASGKMLMVTFGANWCPDCLTLHENLHEPETEAYANEHFEMLSIDVGDSQKSAAVKRDLGFAVNAIPLALFYSADGDVVGDTFGGELKPSRHYTAREIRDFLREVVDYHRIVSPDQRQ
jgi:thioredoxin 1